MMDSRQTVALQVMWNRLISIVEEQAQALIRTAFSTSVREAGDLSAGVYDVKGRMLAQAVTGTPGHVNAMAAAVGHFIVDIGADDMHDGDVYITNNPWKGTGHLHDITVVTPTFVDNALIGFFACTAHVVDIGGRGFSPDADSVFEEGLHIPIMALTRRGEVDETLINIVRSNVREPEQVVGDIFALAACNTIGQQRLLAMLDEFQLTSVADVAEFILERSRQATLACIAALPRTQAAGLMTVDGYDTPVRLQVQLRIHADRIDCDFAGSSGIDKKGINVPLVYTQAYACYALKCAIAPQIPNNHASLAPFVISAPDNTIVNALHPAPVALRHVIGHMIPDAVYNALDKILPRTVPAEGAGTICNFQMSVRPRRDVEQPVGGDRAEVLTFNSGGGGARPTQDGMDTTAFPSGVMTMPVEVTEQTGPVVIWRKELRPDSGGAGEFRGGLGQFMDVGALPGYECDFSAMLDRVQHPARGRHGGADGAPTTICRDDGQQMRGKGKQYVPHGKQVHMAFPGGGGYGDPADRDLAKVRHDLLHGYISPSVATDIYGLSATEAERVMQARRTSSDIK